MVTLYYDHKTLYTSWSSGLHMTASAAKNHRQAPLQIVFITNTITLHNTENGHIKSITENL